MQDKEDSQQPTVTHGRWPPETEHGGVKPSSPPCEQERCVNFCLVPLSSSFSKWSTSPTTGEGKRGRSCRSGRLGGGGRLTPHTGSLCAVGTGVSMAVAGSCKLQLSPKMENNEAAQS